MVPFDVMTSCFNVISNRRRVITFRKSLEMFRFPVKLRWPKTKSLDEFIFYLYESRGTPKSFTLFITVKTITKLNLGHVGVVHVFWLTTQNFQVTATRTSPNKLQKGLTSRTVAVHVRYNYWCIFCRPLQNNNVK